MAAFLSLQRPVTSLRILLRNSGNTWCKYYQIDRHTLPKGYIWRMRAHSFVLEAALMIALVLTTNTKGNSIKRRNLKLIKLWRGDTLSSARRLSSAQASNTP